jgi:hypothetical protein
MPERLQLLKLRPLSGLAGAGALKALRRLARYWRDKLGLSNLYGARFEAGMRPSMSLVLSAEVPRPDGGRSFDIELIADNVTPDEALAWLQAEYQDEALNAWESNEDLAILLADTKGRRRFQGIGNAFKATETTSCLQEGEPASSNTVNNLRKTPPAGGSGHSRGRSEGHKCPFCGGAAQMYGFRVGVEEVQKDPLGRGFYWHRDVST